MDNIMERKKGLSSLNEGSQYFLKDIYSSFNANILIVDDNKLERTVITDILKSYGHTVWESPDGDAALKVLKQFKPDVILLDLIMPAIDGLQMCRIIRKTGQLSDVPIIVISSKGDKKTIAEALSYGANDFIAKPVDELELLARLHSQIRQRQMFMELEEDKKNLEITLEILKAISATLNTEEVLYTIVEKAAEITNAHRSSIVLIDKGRDVGYVLASNDDPNIKSLVIDLNRYPEIKKVMMTSEAVAIDDLSTHPITKEIRGLVEGFKNVSVLVVPIGWEEEVMGTLLLRSRRANRTFTQQEINFCKVVASASINALRNAHLFKLIQEEKERLEIVAITDQLTNAYNHSYFYMRLDEEYQRAKRYKLPLACMMMDIDEFKRINDRYGHLTGDSVLRELAHNIQRAIRKNDFLARYGGEEFSILLPHTDLGGAFKEAERIRKVVENLSFKELPRGDGLTISIGVAAFPDDTIKGSHDLIGNADKGLYKAKGEGKNKAIAYPF